MSPLIECVPNFSEGRRAEVIRAIIAALSVPSHTGARRAIRRRPDVLILGLPNVRYLGYRFGANPVERVVKGGRMVVG